MLSSDLDVLIWQTNACIKTIMHFVSKSLLVQVQMVLYMNTCTFGARGDHVVDYQSRWEISPLLGHYLCVFVVFMQSLRQRKSTWHCVVSENPGSDILANNNHTVLSLSGLECNIDYSHLVFINAETKFSSYEAGSKRKTKRLNLSSKIHRCFISQPNIFK